MSKEIPDKLLEDLSAILDGECTTSRQVKALNYVSNDPSLKEEFECMKSLQKACQDALKSEEFQGNSNLWDQIAFELREVNEEERQKPAGFLETLSLFELKPSFVAAGVAFFLLVAVGVVVDFDQGSLVTLLDSLRFR